MRKNRCGSRRSGTAQLDRVCLLILVPVEAIRRARQKRRERERENATGIVRGMTITPPFAEIFPTGRAHPAVIRHGVKADSVDAVNHGAPDIKAITETSLM